MNVCVVLVIESKKKKLYNFNLISYKNHNQLAKNTMVYDNNEITLPNETTVKSFFSVISLAINSNVIP